MQRTRLDKFIRKSMGVTRKNVQLLLAQKRVRVDDAIVTDSDLIVDKFSNIVLDGEVLQQKHASYVMLHKPVGVVSATKDDIHSTVIDLLALAEYPEKHELHIVGRLDLNTSGLVLLTNDSRWSERLTLPQSKVAKHYQVQLEQAISNEQANEYKSAFAAGFYFKFENITTQPATFELLSPHCANVTLIEGKYHQVKRMFGRFQNKVIGLHRYAIGNLFLDDQLKVGQSRRLTACEVANISVK